MTDYHDWAIEQMHQPSIRRGRSAITNAQIVSSLFESEPDENGNVTMTASDPLRDENGDIVFLTPGRLDLGIICVYCGYNATDSCEPGEDSKAMMAGVRADFNRHMLEVHGIDNG